MPLSRPKKGEAQSEPVLSKHEVIDQAVSILEELNSEPPVVDVVISPPAIVIDEKNPKKDK